jgi:hypothetical protein
VAGLAFVVHEHYLMVMRSTVLRRKPKPKFFTFLTE